jgi:hypothetical protein
MVAYKIKDEEMFIYSHLDAIEKFVLNNDDKIRSILDDSFINNLRILTKVLLSLKDRKTA